MAQNQEQGARSKAAQGRMASELRLVKASASVPGNKKPAGIVAVAFQFALQVASIGVAGTSRVVATPPVGFCRAAGGSSSNMRAAHITKPSTGRGITSGPAKPGLFPGRAG